MLLINYENQILHNKLLSMLENEDSKMLVLPQIGKIKDYVWDPDIYDYGQSYNIF